MDEKLIRVNLGESWSRPRMIDLFRKTLRERHLLSEDYLYHPFDGRGETLLLVEQIGCEVRQPIRYSCGTYLGITDRTRRLYNPLESAVALEKPGLLVYRRRSLAAIDGESDIYRFRGQNYQRGLVAVLLAKRPRSTFVAELRHDP